MNLLSIKKYILFIIIIVLCTEVIYNLIVFNIKALFPWSLATLFFILWKIKGRTSKKSKSMKIKRLL